MDGASKLSQRKTPSGKTARHAASPRNTIINDEATDGEAFIAFKVLAEGIHGYTMFSATTGP